MNRTSSIQSDWADLKSIIKTKWDRLSEDEIEIFKDNFDLISSKIQNVYGYAKDYAENKYMVFKETFIMPEKNSLTPEQSTKKS